MSGVHNSLHNPLPASLASECKKAGKILESFVSPEVFKLDESIPRHVLGRAKGLAIFTILRAGFFGSVRFGSGLLVARLPDGSWSTPSALATGGIGVGSNMGIELTDFVFVLTSDKDVQTFTQAGSLTLGGNISLALGSFGRSVEAGGAAGVRGVSGMFSYSRTRGVFGGTSLEGGLLAERPDANKKMYGRDIRANELLNGSISPPPDAEPLMRVLNTEQFCLKPPAEIPTELPSGDAHEQRAELPAQPPQTPHEPSLGIPEAPGDTPPVELGTGAPHEIFEMPTDSPHDISHELDAGPISAQHFSGRTNDLQSR